MSNTAGVYAQVRATDPLRDGKWYFECRNTGSSSSTSVGLTFGVATKDAALTAGLTGVANNWTVAFADNTRIYQETSLVNASGTLATNSVMQLAVDTISRKVWVGKDNQWFSSTGDFTGDPSAGVNPTFTYRDEDVYVITGGYSGNCEMTGNFGGSPFEYSIPAGFESVADAPFGVEVKVISKDADAVPFPTITVDGGEWTGSDGSGTPNEQTTLVKETPYNTKLTVAGPTDLALMTGSVFSTDGSGSPGPYTQTPYKLTTTDIESVSAGAEVISYSIGYLPTDYTEKKLQTANEMLDGLNAYATSKGQNLYNLVREEQVDLPVGTAPNPRFKWGTSNGVQAGEQFIYKFDEPVIATYSRSIYDNRAGNLWWLVGSNDGINWSLAAQSDDAQIPGFYPDNTNNCRKYSDQKYTYYIFSYNWYSNSASTDNYRLDTGKLAEEVTLTFPGDVSTNPDLQYFLPGDVVQQDAFVYPFQTTDLSNSKGPTGVVTDPTKAYDGDLTKGCLGGGGTTWVQFNLDTYGINCLLYTSPSPRDRTRSRMPSSA